MITPATKVTAAKVLAIRDIRTNHCQSCKLVHCEVMKAAFIAAALFGATISTGLTQAQYAGTYWVNCVWMNGVLKGYGSAGPATATRRGRVVITQYFFADDSAGQMVAKINKRGVISLNRPNGGKMRIMRSGKNYFAGGTFAARTFGSASGGSWTFSNVYR